MQAYNLGHLRHLGLDEEAKRPCFKADSDLGEKEQQGRCLSEACGQTDSKRLVDLLWGMGRL